MSRIGKLPIPIPDGVKCELKDAHLKVTGPKGALELTVNSEMAVELADNELTVTRPSDKKEHRALHGLTRALINNMVIGVSQGYQRTLLIEGVGYRASMQGKTLNLALGFSHPVAVEPPAGIDFVVEGTQTIKVSGIDKQQVGQVAANIRAIRPPEPYKGKGVRYEGEYIRRKVSKATA